MQRIENSTLFCQPGSAPVRVVIGELESGFVTCLEIVLPDQEPWRCHQLPAETFDQALADYERRIRWLMGKPQEGVKC